MRLVKSEYHIPRYLPSLAQDGLTHDDIARALGVQVQHVVEKLKRIDIPTWKSMGWDIHVDTVKSGKVGRPRIVWMLNTNAAKVFVARWENERGNGYLSFLLSCEREAIERNPQKALPGKRHLVDVPVGCVVQRSLFGDDVVIPILAKVDRERLRPEELRKAKSQHLTRIIEGAAQAKRRLEDEEIVESLPPTLRPGVANA